ncbi:MAG: non-ribosomal peptide synthetase, partial [Planctomycetes bacterium]|nr:non-ribosomal peptide synthetase [Planctomycetota bacterium]
DPEKLRKLSDELPYDVEISWANTGKEGRYDVLFKARAQTANKPWLIQQLPFTAHDLSLNWHGYANNPLHRKLGRKVVPILRKYLQAQLPEYMVPSAFVMLESIPLTPNGKVDRRALPDPESAFQTLEESYVAPQTATEESLTTIWAEVLGLPKIGISDNFFEAGGHSLLATQVISQIRETFEMELPLRLMFEKTTVAELAESIDTFRIAAQPVTTEIPEEECEGGRL